MKIVSIAAIVLFGWLGVTTVMLGLQLRTARDRIALGVQQQAVSEKAGRVEAYRSSIDSLAARIEARQKTLDQIVSRYFGETGIAVAPQMPAGQQTSALTPESAPLAKIENRQTAFAESLTIAAGMRAQQAEAAIRGFGLNPNALARSRRNVAMGGPYIPFRRDAAPQAGTPLARLAHSLQRLDTMERTLLAIPNSAPTRPMTLSSGFGYRADPFHGGGAMHAGLDITGDHGQPILAASAGRVVTAGRQAGYGNLVVIDHGHGLETRYGHLSGFTVKAGDIVARGQQIARMGSTGRSTGTHLHFEVRSHGRALNPRPFLESDEDVLEVQNSVGQRLAQPQKRG